MMKNRTRGWFLTRFIAAALVIGTGAGTVARAQDTTYQGQRIGYASAIELFLAEDRVHPPPREAILFIGSSIFREWGRLREQMAPLPVFNRAFGGSRTAEVLYYMDRIVLPYRPRIIVYYCGSNDINAGEHPGAIAGRFIEFSARVQESLPGSLIFFVSINKAPQKKDRWDVVDSTNALVREYCWATRNRGYIDVNPLLFDSAQHPRLELYRDDLLHFKEKAYDEFARVIKPVLLEAWKWE
jgi:hypothetical protein